MKPRRVTVKPERKPYRFTLLMDKEKELIEYLDSFPKPVRGRVIVEALKLQMRTLIQGKQHTEKETLKGEPSLEFKGVFNF